MIWVTILVVALLTSLILALAVLAYQTAYSSAKKEMAEGVRDIGPSALGKPKRGARIRAAIANSISAAVCVALVSIAAVSATSRAMGNQIEINGRTSLVIASGSMSGFYDDAYERQIVECKPEAESEHFAVGDILTFSRVSESESLTPYDVYGYMSNGKVIVHRYIPYMNADDKLAFRGDNAAGRDKLVDRSAVRYHWSGGKVGHIGMIILFGQSWFGLYSCIGVACVIAISDIYMSKLRKAEREYAASKAAQAQKDRNAKVYADYAESMSRGSAMGARPADPKGGIDPRNGRKIKKEFTTTYGKKVVIYERERPDGK